MFMSLLTEYGDSDGRHFRKVQGGVFGLTGEHGVVVSGSHSDGDLGQEVVSSVMFRLLLRVTSSLCSWQGREGN